MKTYYKKGDWNVICDRCGGKFKRSETRKEWNGLITCLRGCWEPRHPQDFVRSKRDQNGIPDGRTDTISTGLTTTLTSGVSKDDTTIQVNSISNISDADSIGISLNDGTTFWTTVNGDPSGSTVVLKDAVWGAADSGNTVYLGQTTSDTFQ